MAGGPSKKGGAPLTKFWAVVTTLKGMIGAGVLGLPVAFGSVGLSISLPGSVFIAFINALGAWRLIQTKIHLLEKKFSVPEDAKADDSDDSQDPDEWYPTSYGREMEDCGLGPVAAVGKRLFGSAGILFAALAVIGTQLGICLAYVVIIQVTFLRMPGLKDVSPFLLRIIAAAIFAGLCLVRKLSSLAILSIVALATYIFVVADLVGRGWHGITSGENMTPSQAFSEIHAGEIGAWFGSSVFAFEGIVLAQYVFDDMQLGKNMGPFRHVLTWSYAVSWLLFAFVGVYGYLAYGKTIANPFYLSFPDGNVDTFLDKFVLALVLFLSFALQMYPVFSFLDYIFIRQEHAGDDIMSDPGDGDEDDMMPHHSAGKRTLDRCLRIITALLVCVLGAMLPKVTCVTDLVGAVFMSLMGFLLPGLFHLTAFRKEISVIGIIGDVVLIAVGATSMVLGVMDAPKCFAGE